MRTADEIQPAFEPCCMATTIGSLPHTNVAHGTSLILEYTPEIPSWVQFPRRNAYENMMMQFTEGMPGRLKDGGRFYFDTEASDFLERLTEFYTRYLAVTEEGDLAALDCFGLSVKYAAGFTELVSRYPQDAATQRTVIAQGAGDGTLHPCHGSITDLLFSVGRVS